MEVWRDVKGYEGKYQVSNYGNVKSIERKTKRNDGVLYTVLGKAKKPTKWGAGYEVVNLWKSNKQHMEYVHRLVAEAFIKNPENKPYINHIDGNKTNNNVDNLEWCTAHENADHAWRTGLRKGSKPIRCVETGEIFPGSNKASMMICGSRRMQSSISACAIGKKKTYLGLHWEFVNNLEVPN